MATPGQLVQTVSEMLGIPAETVTNYDRVLSESGMRSKSGRGRGAAKVTARDAAYLLIAILGSPIAGASVKEAANTCRRYGSMPVLGHVSGTHNFAKVGLKMLDALPKKHTLHDGISALIDSAAKGEHYFIRGAKRQSHWTDRLFVIRLTGPRPWAEITADTSFGEGKNFARRVYTGSKFDEIGKDLHQERKVTYRTIRALGSLLSAASQ
jgi:hypothetical protein